MKPVERYHAELDCLTAPDALKAKLLAIPAQYAAEDEGERAPLANTPSTTAEINTLTQAAATTQTATQPTPTTSKQKGKAIRFALPPNWKKYALTAAACFAIGVLASDATGLQIIPRMGTDSAEIAMFDTSTSTTAESATTIDDTSSYNTAPTSDTAGIDLSSATRTESAVASIEDNSTEPAAISETAEPELTFWSRAARAFRASLVHFTNTIANAILFIVSIWVWLALALVAVFVYYSIKKKRK